MEIVLCMQQSGGEPYATLQGPRQEDRTEAGPDSQPRL